MPVEHPLNLVLCWHMHQPDYYDPLNDSFTLPWTYLHAIKDYTDMAAHLEQTGNACAVVNFAPVLLEQIDTYAGRIDSHLKTAAPLPDPLLAALAAPRLSRGQLGEHGRQALLKRCLDGCHQQFMQRHPAYVRLIDFNRHLLEHHDRIAYINDSFFYDLLTWHHLAWLGETVHRNDPRVERLRTKAMNFTPAERRELLSIIGEQISAIIPRYRALAENGRVELAISPYAHPLAPLLLEWQSAREANPELPLPETADYPGGKARLRWQIEEGIRVFSKHFGQPPRGCWPSEGALSDATLQLLNEAGFQWTASGAGVLYNSLNSTAQEHLADTALYHPYRVADNPISCFFRDDQLSDLIGFTYATWHADDAVANLVHHLEHIAQRCTALPNAIAAIIMDGENAWEHYPNNGFYFLQALYRRLANHPRLQLTTFSRYLDNHRDAGKLQRLVAGSWVYGNLTTWIGSRDKNRAWEMLVEAKQTFDRVSGELSPDRYRAALRQLAVCEGSDWFWWPGGDNPPPTVAVFDSLYRMHLNALYRLLEQPPPLYLAQPFSSAEGPAGAPLGGVMRKSQ